LDCEDTAITGDQSDFGVGRIAHREIMGKNHDMSAVDADCHIAGPWFVHAMLLDDARRVIDLAATQARTRRHVQRLNNQGYCSANAFRIVSITLSSICRTGPKSLKHSAKLISARAIMRASRIRLFSVANLSLIGGGSVSASMRSFGIGGPAAPS
jgi:hypothetical protein